MGRVQLILALLVAAPLSGQSFEDGRSAGSRVAAEAFSPWGALSLAALIGTASGGALAYWTTSDEPPPMTDGYVIGGGTALAGILAAAVWQADTPEASGPGDYGAGFREGYRETITNRRMVTALVGGALALGGWYVASRALYDEERASRNRRSGGITIHLVRLPW